MIGGPWPRLFYLRFPLGRDRIRCRYWTQLLVKLNLAASLPADEGLSPLNRLWIQKLGISVEAAASHSPVSCGMVAWWRVWRKDILRGANRVLLLALYPRTGQALLL